MSLSICPSQEMLEKATSSSVPKITLRVLMTKLLVYILKLYRFIALKTFFNGTWTWWHGGNLKSTSYPNTTANQTAYNRKIVHGVIELGCHKTLKKKNSSAQTLVRGSGIERKNLHFFLSACNSTKYLPNTNTEFIIHVIHKRSII